MDIYAYSYYNANKECGEMKFKDTNLQDLSLYIEFDNMQEKQKVISILNNIDAKLVGYKRGKQYLLDIESIYYIELVDKQAFIYTQDDCYESPLWLYQLEEKLSDAFVRANKSTLLNMNHIESLKADIGSRIMVYLDNRDQILVSRTYSKEFKRKLKGDTDGNNNSYNH